MLVSEIKSVGNAVFLEVLVMEGEIGFLAIRIKISYVEDSRQCLFIHFIANRPIWYIFACNIVSSGKIKTSHVQNFFCFWTKCREPVKDVIYRKKEWGHRAFKRVILARL